MIEFEILSGDQRGRIFRPPAHECTIGRSADNIFSIENPHISSFHGLVKKTDGKYIYEDLASTNGTLVNGMPISRQEIVEGDVIILGDTKLKLLIRSEG